MLILIKIRIFKANIGMYIMCDTMSVFYISYQPTVYASTDLNFKISLRYQNVDNNTPYQIPVLRTIVHDLQLHQIRMK